MKAGWFGKSWGAPVCTPEDHRPTPAGQSCIWCSESIEEGDTGFIDMAGQPMHFECSLRSVMGGANHLVGRCQCCGGDQPPDPPGLTNRQAARLALYLYDMQRRMSPKAFKTWVDTKLSQYQELVANGQIEYPGFDLQVKPRAD